MVGAAGCVDCIRGTEGVVTVHDVVLDTGCPCP